MYHYFIKTTYCNRTCIVEKSTTSFIKTTYCKRDKASPAEFVWREHFHFFSTGLSRILSRVVIFSADVWSLLPPDFYWSKHVGFRSQVCISRVVLMKLREAGHFNTPAAFYILPGILQLQNIQLEYRIG